MSTKTDVWPYWPRSRQAIIDELFRIATFNHIDALEDDDKNPLSFKPLDELAPDVVAAIRDTRIVSGNVEEIRPYDKMAALDKLCRHFGILGGPITETECSEESKLINPSKFSKEDWEALHLELSARSSN